MFLRSWVSPAIRWPTLAAMVAASTFAAGCSTELAATEVLVVVDSDLDVGNELTSLRVRLFDMAGTEAHERHDFALADDAESGKGHSLPLSFSVAPARSDSAAGFRLVVTGRGPGPKGDVGDRVEQQLLVRFRPREQVRVEVFLARACLDELCRAGPTLENLSCKPTSGECVPLEQGMTSPDGGMDVGQEAGEPQQEAGEPQPEAGLPSLVDVAIAQAGDTCDTQGELACAGHAQRVVLRCVDQHWQTEDTCQGDTRCDTRLGPSQGTCLSIEPACVEREPGEAADCSDVATIARCGDDLLTLQTAESCPELATCVPPSGTDELAKCVCDAGFTEQSGACVNIDDCDPDPCNGHGTCTDGHLSFTCDCDEPWGNATCDEHVIWVAPYGIDVDHEGQRLLVLDRSLRGFYWVDLGTGNRSLILDGQTAPPPHESPDLVDVAVDVIRGTAYVVDPSLEALLAVGFSNGAWSVISDAHNDLVDPPEQVGEGAEFGLPREVFFEPVSQQIIVSDPLRHDLILVDEGTGDRRQLSGDARGEGPGLGEPRGIAFEPENNRLLVALLGSQRLAAVDFETGDRERLDVHGDDFGEYFGLPVDVASDRERSRALVLDASASVRAILAVAYEDGKTTLFSGSEQTGPPFVAPLHMVRSGDRLYVADSGQRQLMSVHVDNGEREAFSDPSVGTGPQLATPSGLLPRGPDDRAWLTDREHHALLAVDVDSGDREIVSDPEAEVAFVSPQDLAIDEAGGRLLVVDSSLAAVVGVDIETGAQTVVSGTGVGDGDPLVSPSSIFVDPSWTRAIVSDSGNLVTVALSDGSRAPFVSSFTSAIDVAWHGGNTGRRYLVLEESRLAGITARGVSSVISDDADHPELPFDTPVSVTVDFARDRALVIDAGTHQLIGVDLSSGARSVVSSRTVGKGPGFWSPGHIEVDGDRAFIVDSTLDAVIAVDLSTGDRMVVSF